MKQYFLLASVTLTLGTLAQTNSETLPDKRPVLFGVTTSETVFLGPAILGSVANQNYDAFYNGYSIGTMLVIPIQKKWEVEGSFEFCRWSGRRETHRNYVLPYSTTNWEEWSSHDVIRDDWRTRVTVSYEVFQNRLISLHAGTGGSVEMLNKFNWVPGRYMAEAGLKIYGAPVKWLPIQFGLWYGRSQYADYLTLRAAILLRGDRN